MKRRTFALFLAVILLLSSVPYKVSASSSDAAFKSALKDFCQYEPTDEQVWTWSYIITTCKTDGLSDNAIAGIMGNMLYESGGGVFAVEGMYTSAAIQACGKHYKDFKAGETYDYGSYEPGKSRRGDGAGSSGNGHGLVQWSFGRARHLSDICSSLPDGIGYVTVTHREWQYDTPRWVDNGGGNYTYYYTTNTYKIPDLAGQLLFMLQELNGTFSDADYSWVKANMQADTTPQDAAEEFRSHYEVGGVNSASDRQAAAGRAIAAIQACSGVSGTVPSGAITQQGQQSLAANLVDLGIWGTSQMSAYCSLTETNLEETLLKVVDKSKLSQTDLESLTDWNRNKGMQEEQNGYISILRRAVVLVGILLTLWAILVYLAYWFDHINTLFYIDTLHLVTLGQLHICPPGDKPTFSLGKKVKTRTVSHMQILGVCATAILFGVLLISGVFYTIVAKFVNLILGVLNR